MVIFIPFWWRRQGLCDFTTNMQTDFKDYLMAGLAIGLILSVTLASLYLLQDLVVAAIGILYAPIALAVGFLLLYGLYSALVLALLHRFSPLRPGEYGLDHPQFALWKLRHILTLLAKAALTPFFPVFMRQHLYALLGARIGKHVAVAGTLLDPTLLTLEEGCVIGEGAIITGHTLVRDRFILGEVKVGKAATVGVAAVVFPASQVGGSAIVLPQAFVKLASIIPEGEAWGGIPAAPIRTAAAAPSTQAGGR